MNFDTTNGLPFPYFDIMSIVKDRSTSDLTITYRERMALKGSDGVTYFLNNPETEHSFVIRATALADKFDLIDLATGKHLTQQSSYATLLIGNISAVRAHQEMRYKAPDSQA